MAKALHRCESNTPQIRVDAVQILASCIIMIIIIIHDDLDKYNFWHKSLSSLNINIIEINSQIVLLKA
jgi:hypothetical protein